jgi:UDP-N-acetyl-D-galactosamine dehydrogenase
VLGAQALVLGVAFKENVRDTRNTQVVEVVQELTSNGVVVSVFDPLVRKDQLDQLGLHAVVDPFEHGVRYDALILAVPHRYFCERTASEYLKLFREGGRPVFVDVKGVFRDVFADNDILYWSL